MKFTPPRLLPSLAYYQQTTRCMFVVVLACWIISTYLVLQGLLIVFRQASSLHDLHRHLSTKPHQTSQHSQAHPQHNAAQHNAAQHSIGQHRTGQDSKERSKEYSGARHITTEYSTAQNSDHAINQRRLEGSQSLLQPDGVEIIIFTPDFLIRITRCKAARRCGIRT